MIQSTDAFPLNFGFTGKGNTSRSSGESCELEEQIKAGAIGFVGVSLITVNYVSSQARVCHSPEYFKNALAVN